MNWLPLTDTAQLAEIVAASYQKPQWVFKHSTRCGTSLHAIDRVERMNNALTDVSDCYYLDLLNYRQVSNTIAEQWNVPHQSPQILLLKGGKIVYHASHQAIDGAKMLALIA